MRRPPTLAGYEVAYLLRLLGAARLHNQPLLPTVEAAGDIAGLPRLRRWLPTLRAAGEEGFLDTLETALDAGADRAGAALLRALRRVGLPAKGLLELASWYRERASSRIKMYQAVSYPICVMSTIALLYLLFFHTFLAPILMAQFDAMYQTLGSSLPLPTMFFVKLYRPFQLMLSDPLLATLYSGVVLLIAYAVVRFGARLVDLPIALYVPALSRYVRFEAMKRFADTLALQLQYETPMPEALGLAAAVVSNSALRRRLASIAPRVAAGESLGEILREAQYLPRTPAWRLWAAYYRAEFLPELRRVSELCLREIDIRGQRVRGAATVIAWALVLFLIGPSIGTLVIAAYLPLFNLISKIG